ncbi:ATP-binding protein [Microbulbifer epialgicus]|uniref:ATP-binding protein n=1 Tax=Microbulbifer epialgicus TaxID=393907 RepID=A0ABV4P072_9GAMM
MTAVVQSTPEMTLATLRAGLDAALESTTARLRAISEGKPLPHFSVPDTSALPSIASIFSLNEGEQELISLAAGCELDPGIAKIVSAVNGSGNPDPWLAVQLLGPQAWDLLCPEAPLRRWRLIELTGSGPLRQRQFRLDERILQALLGNRYLDARLEGLLHRILPVVAPGPAASGMVHSIIEAWCTPGRLPLLLLGGRDQMSKRILAAAAAQELGIQLYRLRAADIPSDWTQRTALALLLDRELALSGAAVLIEADPENTAAAAILVDLLSGPSILSAADPPLPERTPRLRLDLEPPSPAERLDTWRNALGSRAEVFGSELERIATHFNLDPSAIASATAIVENSTGSQETLAPMLWTAARAQGRRALEGLAERIDCRASWEQLVLPAEQIAILQDLAGHLRNAWKVSQSWGWAARSSRGLGAAALFAGPSGTGKTLAAEVLANELSLDLYCIDLSQVISKYIGETEKNLARIFAAAEDGGAILLFDEADALFGKRSEVKDSHDRYANVEVSYLLQKMESYGGLAILTSNQKSALDTAFLRRLRYILNFPFPDAAARAEIWARIFPAETPCEGLNPQALARLNISGGAIRSIALNAAYLAAAVPEPVQMAHIHRAVRREYGKLEKTFTGAEQEAFR